jgi:hypothetical protein
MNFEIIGSIDRGVLILYPELLSLFPDESLDNFYSFYATFLLQFKQNDIIQDFFEKFQNDLVIVDNLSQTDFIVTVYSKTKITERNQMFVKPGSTPSIMSYAEVLKPFQGSSWFHFGDTTGLWRKEIFNFVDELYETQFFSEIYMIVNINPLKGIYIATKEETEAAYFRWQVKQKMYKIKKEKEKKMN